MDRRKEAGIVVKAINEFQDSQIKDYELIKIVCEYFDKLKLLELTQNELKFLKYISNIVGIPHYYDALNEKFNQNINIQNYDLTTLSSFLQESTLHLSENYKVHKYQKQILDKFEIEKQNRYFLSASTSFGKTHLVYDIIKKMNYDNIILIFPTVALLSENLERLLKNPKYADLKNKYHIHTLSETTDISTKNIFIYTPERFLSFSDKNKYNFDFVFIDEIYKLDNDYIIDNTSKENERDVAYRLASFEILNNTKDVLLAGPYIQFQENKNNSFKAFLDDNFIKSLNYNNYEIVNKKHFIVERKQVNLILDDNRIIEFSKPNDKNAQLTDILKNIYENNENSIIYCYTGYSAEQYATKIIRNKIIKPDISKYKDFLEHIKTRYSEDWIIYKALYNQIGIHHGLVPKYIQKEIINLFNNGYIRFLLSTTTITEGVNTTAKNLIVMHNSKGSKPLKPFDAKNIAGRAGRFLEHYAGRVIALEKDFEDTLQSEEQLMKHKNYDIDIPKDDIDYFCTKNEYLNEQNLQDKKRILENQKSRNLPEELFIQFKAVSRNDKIKVYDNIKLLSRHQLLMINQFIAKTNMPNISIDFDGLQVVLDCIFNIVKENSKLYFLLKNKTRKGYSVFISLLYFYLKDGFYGTAEYKKGEGCDTDKAIRETADFVYNILKYHVVKYLGIFNLMYKYIKADENFSKIEDVVGIDRLLTKLEYNAFTANGRIISDYGVPLKVLEYHETKENFGDLVANKLKNQFDTYENNVFEKLEDLFN